jgi:hypothetical protein
MSKLRGNISPLTASNVVFAKPLRCEAFAAFPMRTVPKNYVRGRNYGDSLLNTLN